MKNAIKLGIKNIREQNLEFNYPELEKIAGIDPMMLDIEISAAFLVQCSNATIQVRVGAKYIYNEVKLFSVNVVTSFVVDDLHEILNDNKQSVKKEALLALLEIAVGHLRGVIAVRTQTSTLEQFPLMLIDIPELLGYVEVNMEE